MDVNFSTLVPGFFFFEIRVEPPPITHTHFFIFQVYGKGSLSQRRKRNLGEGVVEGVVGVLLN